MHRADEIAAPQKSELGEPPEGGEVDQELRSSHRRTLPVHGTAARSRRLLLREPGWNVAECTGHDDEDCDGEVCERRQVERQGWALRQPWPVCRSY